MSFQFSSVRDSISKWISSKPLEASGGRTSTPLSSPGKITKSNTTSAGQAGRPTIDQPPASHSGGNKHDRLSAAALPKSALPPSTSQPSKSVVNTCEPILYPDVSQGVASHNAGATPKRVSKNKNATKASSVNDKRQGTDESPD